MHSSNYNDFKANDKFNQKDDFHAWKMTFDLNLEDQDVMDYVQGKIQEPPSTTTVVAKTKYKKGDVKAKLMIRDSIHKSLVAYISELGHYCRECPFKKVKKRKAPSGGNGQPFKKVKKIQV